MADQTNTKTTRIATFLLKGGVGKSTTTSNLAVALHRQDNSVLVMDLVGGQHDLTTLFGVEDQVSDEDFPTIDSIFDEQWSQVEDLLAESGDSPLDRMAVPTGEGPDLIPARDRLGAVDVELSTRFDSAARYELLDDFITKHVDGHYDFVLIDLPGSEDNLTESGLWAADAVISPVTLGNLEAKQLRELRDDLREIREDYGRDVHLEWTIPNEVTRSESNVSKNILADLEADENIPLSPSYVPKSSDIRTAQARGCSLYGLSDDEDHRTLDTARRALDAYDDLAEHLTEKYTDNGPSGSQLVRTAAVNGPTETHQ